MIQYSPLAGLVVTLVAAAVLSAILIRINPYSRDRLPANPNDYDMAAIEEKFRPFWSAKYFEAVACLLPIIPICLGLNALQQYFLTQRSEGAVSVIGNYWWNFGVAAAFLSILVGGLFFYYLLGWFARKRATREEFTVWAFPWEANKIVDYQGYQFTVSSILNRPHAMSILIILIVFGSFLGIFLMVDSYAIITDRTIIANDLFSLHEHEYPYDEIDRILYVDQNRNRVGKIEPREDTEYLFFFNDGSRYSSRFWGSVQPREETEIVRYISTRSGVPIQHGILNIDVPAGLI